jgi:hypothetical protein
MEHVLCLCLEKVGCFKKHQHRPRRYGGEFHSPRYQRGRFLKKVLIFEKKMGADFFPGFVWWVVWAESPIQI